MTWPSRVPRTRPTGGRLRGFQEPSAYTQPDHYYAGGDTLGLGYAGVTGTTQGKDYKRVGILDKAAYLIAAGGTHPSAGSDPATYPPIAVYGIGARCFENILYYVQTQLMGPADVFVDFRQEMIDAADALYPDDPCKAQTVARAFDAVGIYEEGDTPPALLGPDPMITPWGARTDHPPYWQSPDIYVKDAGGAIAPPLKGQMNRLIALVTNIGDVDAIGVDVAFSFKPYGMGTSGNAEKTIGTDNLDVAAGASVEVEIPWDLTNLADTNGGQWPLPLGNFDHFCVVVRLAHGPDVDTCNNAAQNNFGRCRKRRRWRRGLELCDRKRREARAMDPRCYPTTASQPTGSVELDLKNVFAGNASAARELAEIKDAEVPWVGAARDAIVIPMRGRESRAAQFRWKIRSREAYDGAHSRLPPRARRRPGRDNREAAGQGPVPRPEGTPLPGAYCGTDQDAVGQHGGPGRTVRRRQPKDRQVRCSILGPDRPPCRRRKTHEIQGGGCHGGLRVDLVRSGQRWRPAGDRPRRPDRGQFAGSVRRPPGAAGSAQTPEAQRRLN